MYEVRLRNEGPGRALRRVKKDVQGSEKKTRQLPEGTKENNIVPNEWSLICPLGIAMIILQQANIKNCASGQTCEDIVQANTLGSGGRWHIYMLEVDTFILSSTI